MIWPRLTEKTKHLEDAAIRSELFYQSSSTEKWYQKLKSTGSYDSVAYGSFLPVCADFCQGSDLCALDPIQPNSHGRTYKEILLLTNQYCVSSCDDFTWRMNKYADAKLVGLPPAADATYSRIHGKFILKSDGTIEAVYGHSSKPNGMVLATMDIPYSKLIDDNGDLVEGRPPKVDIPVDITSTNFEHKNTAMLDAALAYLQSLGN